MAQVTLPRSSCPKMACYNSWNGDFPARESRAHRAEKWSHPQHSPPQGFPPHHCRVLSRAPYSTHPIACNAVRTLPDKIHHQRKSCLQSKNPACAKTNSSSLSAMFWGRWSVTTQERVPSLRPSSNACRSVSVRNGGKTCICIVGLVGLLSQCQVMGSGVSCDVQASLLRGSQFSH